MLFCKTGALRPVFCKRKNPLFWKKGSLHQCYLSERSPLSCVFCKKVAPQFCVLGKERALNPDYSVKGKEPSILCYSGRKEASIMFYLSERSPVKKGASILSYSVKGNEPSILCYSERKEASIMCYLLSPPFGIILQKNRNLPSCVIQQEWKSPSCVIL